MRLPWVFQLTFAPLLGLMREILKTGEVNDMLVLSGDIGGTNTRLQLAQFEQGQMSLVGHQQYLNAAFEGLNTIIHTFLHGHNVCSDALYSACFAVAGPISNQTVRFTNLPWFVDRAALRQTLALERIALINDFSAIGYGIDAVLEADKVVLQKGSPLPKAPRAIIGAGTGLGVALMYHQGDHYEVMPTEGGHVDFAPTDDEQVSLLLSLRKKYYRVSVERVVSGIGLANIYKFVRDNPLFGETESPALRLALHKTEDVAATVSQFAVAHQDPMALRALNLFIRAYGAAAGNLALSTLSFGGLFLVGGIAPKLLNQLKAGAFMKSFMDKGRMAQLIQEVPVYVVLDTLVGLKGAAIYATRL